MQASPNGKCSNSDRRGVSTLEMVLCLPILLGVMALMINFGTVACWKIRSLSVARHEVWGNRQERSTGISPRAPGWPTSAGQGINDTSDLSPNVDLWPNYPVVRGPMAGGTVSHWLLDPKRGPRRGASDITRRYPMLSSMGDYHLRSRTELLNRDWYYSETRRDLGQQDIRDGGNNYRRVPHMYQLDQVPDPQLLNNYMAAVTALLTAPGRFDRIPLDRDDEFIAYRIRFGWGQIDPDTRPGAQIPIPPEFHPGLHFCSTDHTDARTAVDRLVRSIPEVPWRMARMWVRLYRAVIWELEAMIAANPPPPQSEIAAMRAEIRELESRIDTLNRFLASQP